MTPLAQRIWVALEDEFVKQAKPNGYVLFAKESSTVMLECSIRMTDLVKRIAKVAEEGDPDVQRSAN
jgi:hypothetical protein